MRPLPTPPGFPGGVDQHPRKRRRSTAVGNTSVYHDLVVDRRDRNAPLRHEVHPQPRAPVRPIYSLDGGEGSRMRAGQEREYVEYVRARSVTLRRVAYRLCGDWHAAEDLVQRALVLLYRHWQKASAVSSLDAYVRRMLTNVYLEERRSWWSRQVLPSAEPGSTDGSLDAEADGRVDLMSALARISPGQRAVLVLRYWEGLDVAETAEAMGCSPGTVKSQTSLGIAALRRLLPDYLPEERTSG